MEGEKATFRQDAGCGDGPQCALGFMVGQDTQPVVLNCPHVPIEEQKEPFPAIAVYRIPHEQLVKKQSGTVAWYNEPYFAPIDDLISEHP